MSGEFDMAEFERNLAALERHVAGSAAAALIEAAEQLVGDAQQLCPVDKGTLQASGTVDDSRAAGPQPEVLFGFNTSYAAAVHERTDVSHRIGQAGFLRTAIENGLPRIGRIIAGRVASEGLR